MRFSAPRDDPTANYLRLCLASACAYCSYAMCRSPVLPLLAQHLGASAPLVGLVVGASTLTGVVVKMPAGALSDVLGRRALLMAGAAVFAVLPFAYLLVASITGLVLVRLVHGNATAVFGPVASATISDLAPPDRRGRWIGTYATMQGVGQAAGPVVAGYLIALGDFQPAFVASGILGMCGAAFIARWPRDRRSAHGRAWWRHAMQGVREVGSNRQILITSLVQAGQYLVTGAGNAFLPLYAQSALGLSPARIGWLFGVQTVVTLLVRPLFGALSDRVGRRPLIAAGLVACSAAMAGVSATEGFAALLVSMSVYGVGVALTTSATSAHVTDLTRQGRYGAAHGVFGTIYDIGDAAGPIAAGFLVAAVGYRGLFRIAAVLSFALGVAFLHLSRCPPSPR